MQPHGSLGWPSSKGARLHEADLDDPAAVAAVIDEVRPDRIVHLAAQSSVHQSWLDPGGTLRTNVLGLVHLLEAARRAALRPAVLVVGSAEEYGPVSQAELPVREDAPLRPASPYAVSKVAQGASPCSTAPPRHAGRAHAHLPPHRPRARRSLRRELVRAPDRRDRERARPAVIEVGNLEAVRDFTDVRDVVRAYWVLLEKGEPGEVYNVCSGRGLRIRELLDLLLASSSARVEVRVDPERLRPADVPALVGDPARLRAATGWEPRFPLEETLRDLLDDWRARVAGAPARGP